DQIRGRGLNERAESENEHCRQHEGDIRRRSIAPAPLFCPNSPAAQSNQCQRQRYPQAEVWQPKLEEWSNHAVPCFLQQQTKRGGRPKILRTELEIGRGEIRRILRPAGMPFE